ncbi:MAG: NAD(P)-binding protein, partial [Actinobacteria bacterium]|nr:NAD(P)-binding protein [Actinomycetota bacterium]
MGYDAIVVGAGLGGCAAGCVLAGSGMKVLILEKMPQVGGRCSSIKRDGFTLDTGAHAIFGAEHGSIEEACTLVGKAGAIKWCHFNRMIAVLSDTEIYFDGRTAYFRPYEGEHITFRAMDLVDDMMKLVPEQLLDTGMSMASRMMPLVTA